MKSLMKVAFIGLLAISASAYAGKGKHKKDVKRPQATHTCQPTCPTTCPATCPHTGC
jgi:hypothetical protein